MEQRTVVYQAAGLGAVRLTVQAATVVTGMQRALLRGTAQGYLAVLEQQAGGPPAQWDALRLALTLWYPDLLAATVAAEGLDLALPPEQFLALPDGLIAAWEDAVYALNPHWLGREPAQPPAADAETEKNAAAPGASKSAVG